MGKHWTLTAALILIAGQAQAHVDHDVVAAIEAMFIDPTHTSRPGAHLRWSSASTWIGGAVPNAGAKVLIPSGSGVDFNGDTARLNWIRVQGRLGIAPPVGGDGVPGAPVAMNISVESLIVDEVGELAIGEPSRKIVKPITFTFVDSGPINTVWDTLMLSRGIIVLGRFAVHAEELTPKVLTSGAAIGDRTVALQTPATNWRPGDSLVMPGVALQLLGYAPVKDDDLVVVESVSADRLRVTLTTPLRFAHPAAPGRPMPVANLSRRVIFRSENHGVISRRAHFMIMSPGLYENYAVEGMGRTNKAVTVTDPPNLGNPRGRYSQHVHRMGIRRGVDPSVTVRNVSVSGDPGWAFVCHSSNCDFDSNTAFNVVGSGFTGETGDEIGIFRDNLAIRMTGFHPWISPPIPDESRGVSDFAFTGFGFWQHGGLPMTGNIATGCSTSGFMVMGAPFRLPGGPVIVYPTANLIPPLASWGGSTTVPPFEVPTSVVGNVVFGSLDGVSMWSMGALGPRANAITLGKYSGNYVEAGRHPILLGYSAWQEVRNNTLRGAGNWTQIGITNTGVNSGFVYTGNDIRGMSVGIHDPTHHENEITGNTFQTLTGVLLYNTYQDAGRAVRIADNVMIPLPQSAITTACVGTGYTWPYKPFWRWQQCAQKEVTAAFDMVFTSLYGGQDQTNWAEHFAAPNYPDKWNDTLSYNGWRRLYLQEYDPAFSTADMTTLPAIVRTRQNGSVRTVGDLRSELGLYLGGVVMPLDVATDPRVTGVLSQSDRVQLPRLSVNPNAKFYVVTNVCGGGFTLRVKDAVGTFRDFGPIALASGTWNFPIIPIDGYSRGVPVYCDPNAVPSSW